MTVRGVYQAWVWRPFLHTWKYRGAHELGAAAAALLVECPIPRGWINGQPMLVVPIPLARRRERERGFNQSAVLAERLGELLEWPVLKQALVRVRETKAQAKLTPVERRENVRGAFSCPVPSAVDGRVCLLVDDIVTTGATLESAARALKSAGALHVWAVALVRSDLDL